MDDNYIMIDGETDSTYKFAFFDCSENYYKPIFKKRGLTALITDVIYKKDKKYKIIICDIDKGDAITFCRAMNDLGDEMDRHGYDDYSNYSREFFAHALNEEV